LRSPSSAGKCGKWKIGLIGEIIRNEQSIDFLRDIKFPRLSENAGEAHDRMVDAVDLAANTIKAIADEMV
jgi:hypothetical protein